MPQPVYAGIDLGGTNVALALAGASGEIVAERTIPTAAHAGPGVVLDRIASALTEMAERESVQPQAAGAGIPGLIDLPAGVVRFCPNLPTQWRDVHAAEILRARLRCPVYLLNDCRTAALGELRYGSARGLPDMVYFALGTGVGGAVVIDGKLRLGPVGAAGEIGHQTILPDGPECGCGNRGCLETLASGPALIGEGVRLMRSGLAPKLYDRVEGDAGRVTPKEMAECGDHAIDEAILRAARFLGIGVANMITALHPRIVVIGGGVAGIGEPLFDAVRETVKQRVGMFSPDDVRIEPSTLGDKSGLYGAIALAAQSGRV